MFHLLSSPLVPTTATPEVPFVTLGELPWFHIFSSMLKVQFEENKSERPVDALAVKNIPDPLRDAFKNVLADFFR